MKSVILMGSVMAGLAGLIDWRLNAVTVHEGAGLAIKEKMGRESRESGGASGGTRESRSKVV